MDKNPTFESLAAFLRAVIMAADKDGDPDLRLVYQAAAQGLNEVSGPAGGYLVPARFAPELWARVYSSGQILSRCDRQPMTGSGDTLTIPAVSESGRADLGSRFGGIRTYWTDEAGLDANSNLKADLLTFTLKKLLGLVYTTDDLLEDAPALLAALKRIFGLEASFAIERAIVSGNGIAKPLGILNSTALITVPPEGGQATGSIVYPNLIKMIQRMWGPSNKNAIWLMNNEIFGVIAALANEVGDELFTVGGDGVLRLLSYPVEICEYTSVTGAAGDLVLADFSQYIIVEKGSDPDVLSSIHVKYSTDETALKIRYRVDGQPGWTTPITPLNSTLTQSPFVALGARP